MRIAQIAPLHERVPPRLYGGTERVVSFLTEELVRQGHDVTLFASGDSETSARLVPCCEMALRLNPSVRNHLPYHMIMLEEVRQRLDQFEILHFHIDLLHSSLVRTIANRTLTTLHGRLDLPDLAPFYRTFREFPLVSISNDQQRYLRDDFRELGFEVTEGVGKTGVVGVMRNGKGPTAWLRADMDCNQVRETTGLPWAATEAQRLPDGTEVDVMHACGHDAHVTWLLGCAKAMVGLKDDWSGTLVVYAQPAEEVGLGAQAMVEDRLWERGFPKPDYAFGAHTAPGPVGFVANSQGVRMAGTDQFDVTFTGLGGHGSTPQMTIDPVVMAAQAVLNYQTIISRNIDPQASAVISVGAIEAGTSNNIIPGSATLKLNLRWFDEDVRAKMIKRIDEVGRGVAVGAGVDEKQMPTRHMKGNAGPLVNDAALVARVNPSFAALLGKDKVIDNFPAVMGSEDFQEAFRPLGAVPYAFALIGVAPVDMFLKARAAGRPFPYSNHNSDFFVDLAAIPIGAKVDTVSVLSVLAKRA